MRPGQPSLSQFILLLLLCSELGFYGSLSITQWVDVKRKDFLQNFVHHNVTILLMMFSWSCHFTRIGSLVLVIHDCADPLLELAKLCKYAKRDKVAEVVFGLFTVIWVTMRCFVFPTKVLWSTMNAVEGHVDMFPGYYIFNCLLIILQILNIMWTVLILKVSTQRPGKQCSNRFCFRLH